MTSVVALLAGAAIGYTVGYLMPRRARLVLPEQPCSKTTPHAAHRHSPVASRQCPGVAWWWPEDDAR